MSRVSRLVPERSNDLDRSIAAAAVHNEDFVETEPRRARERVRQRPLFIQSGNDDGDLHNRTRQSRLSGAAVVNMK